jgi:hypothetical protein
MRTGCGGLAGMFGLALGWLLVGFVLMVALGGYLQHGLANDDPARLELGQTAFVFGMGVGLVGFTVSFLLVRRRAAGGAPGSRPPMPGPGQGPWQAPGQGRIPGGVIVQPNTLRAETPPLTDWSRRPAPPPPAPPMANVWPSGQPTWPGQPASANTLGQPIVYPAVPSVPSVPSPAATGARRKGNVLAIAAGISFLILAGSQAPAIGLVPVAIMLIAGVAYGMGSPSPGIARSVVRGAVFANLPILVLIALMVLLGGPDGLIALFALIFTVPAAAVVLVVGCVAGSVLTSRRSR